MTTTAPVELLVCVKCKRGTEISDEGDRPGSVLYGRLASRPLPDGVTVTPVECLQNCESGCSVAMRGGDHRWTYIYGHLDERRDVDLLLDGISLYRNAQDGLIPWRQRPEHFKRNCVARVPPLVAAPPKLLDL